MGDEHQRDADDHAGRGPDVGEQMPAVGLERDAVVLASRAQQHQRHREIDRRGDRGQRQAGERRIELTRRDQPRDGRPYDAGGRQHDQRALDAGGEVFRLGEAVGVIGIRRRGGEAQHRKREQCRRQIDERLERIGEQSDRAGQVPGERLERDRRQCRGDRKPGVAFKPHKLDTGA